MSSFGQVGYEIDANSGSTFPEFNSLGSGPLVAKGIAFMQEGNYNYARSYFNQAIIKATQEDSVKNEILALINIGNLFYYLNELDSSLNYYYQALGKAESIEDFYLQNTIQNNVGIIYASTNNIKEARTAIEKALAISILLDDTFKIALNLINLSAQQVNLGQLTTAETNLKRAEQYLSEINSTRGLHSIYVSLGNLSFQESNYEEALRFFKLGQHYLDGEHSLNRVHVFNNIGRTYFMLNQPDSAIFTLNKAHKLALTIPFLEGASTSLVWLSKTYQVMGEKDTAISLAEANLALKDSIILLEKENWIEESKVKYQFEMKQREFKLLSENSKKRTLFQRVLLVASVIIILLLMVILRMRMKTSKLKDERHRQEKVISKEKLEKAKSKNKELKQTIETINYELVSKTLLIDNKNQIFNSIRNVVNEAEFNSETSNNQHLNQLKSHLLRNNNIENDWEEFEIYFEQVHTNFFKNIHETYPNLKTNDLRLMAFILLQLNAKEISQILNISPDSVRKRKQRLREKLQLDGALSLVDHLFKFAK